MSRGDMPQDPMYAARRLDDAALAVEAVKPCESGGDGMVITCSHGGITSACLPCEARLEQAVRKLSQGDKVNTLTFGGVMYTLEQVEAIADGRITCGTTLDVLGKDLLLAMVKRIKLACVIVEATSTGQPVLVLEERPTPYDVAMQVVLRVSAYNAAQASRTAFATIRAALAPLVGDALTGIMLECAEPAKETT